MENLLQILVFKATIKTPQEKERLAPLPAIKRWTVDCEDCDCVLRVEAASISKNEIMEMVRRAGFECHELSD
ncbi:hypothetical protein [Runella slithyformis]|uniref:HMA domain-containing protein n=1 Tax=Runella slithyformis (strain ATCC 29530 / DSM 19594 / LMG 11500 / NCIMB 11436 / LSU 4) TaxID=761193 RepID=A0A7U3ZP38_RUNSL|nr:hypothetical protein [Runella slithyformis]AEI50776.1 hypothetical protein Runsl_4451 [Runella slithyformis DSM 19594]